MPAPCNSVAVCSGLPLLLAAPSGPCSDSSDLIRGGRGRHEGPAFGRVETPPSGVTLAGPVSGAEDRDAGRVGRLQGEEGTEMHLRLHTEESVQAVSCLTSALG